MRLFQRSLNRAGVPVKYSKGFNPLPRFAIASPLSLGIEGEEEYLDMDLEEAVEIDDFIGKMNRILPKDIQILDALYPEEKDSIAFMINYGLYEITFENIKGLSYEDLEKLLNDWLNSDEILIKRLRKRGKRKIEVEENIIPLIRKVSLKEAKDMIIMEALLKIGEFGNLRVFDFMEAFMRDNQMNDLDKDCIVYKRKSLFIGNEKSLEKPF